MTGDQVLFSPATALGIIAFLLSLLPAGFFVWFWYLRRHEKALSAKVVAGAFLTGIALVLPAFWFEDLAGRLWSIFSPATVNYYASAPIPLQTWQDIALPALGTFLIVATVEEGLRYIALRSWMRFAKGSIDQIFDGLIIGVAVGVGFATLENTLYFLNLFREAHYETLVFVFFLRFLVSTLAHISFSGTMGVLLARNTFEFLSSKNYALIAFLVPWFIHGLFDWTLSIHFGMYSAFILLPALLVLFYWSSQSDVFVIHRKNGKLLAAGEVEPTEEDRNLARLMKEMDSPWNKNAPWLSQTSINRRIRAIKKYEEDK